LFNTLSELDKYSANHVPRREQNGQDRHSFCEVEIEVGATSRNVTVQPDFDFAMSVSFGPGAVEDGVLADAKPACVALVPMSEPAPWPRSFPLWRSRPDSIFVAHLIATAEQVPQVRNLRRATPADAQTAYDANQRPIPRAGIRTRQII
jgi:hypothetical protein